MQTYTVVFSEKNILPGWSWFLKNQNFVTKAILPDSNSITPIKRHDEFGKQLKFVMMERCATCQASRLLTKPEAVRLAVLGGLELPKKIGLFDEFYLDCCETCKPGRLPVVEFIKEDFQEK
jgi:hypothetical protein